MYQNHPNIPTHHVRPSIPPHPDEFANVPRSWLPGTDRSLVNSGPPGHKRGRWDGEYLTMTHFPGLLGLGLIEECKGIPSCGKIPRLPRQRDHWNEEKYQPTVLNRNFFWCSWEYGSSVRPTYLQCHCILTI